MDLIQAFLVTSGRKDLAQDYFLKYSFDIEERFKNLKDKSFFNKVIKDIDFNKIEEFVIRNGGETLATRQKSIILDNINDAITGAITGKQYPWVRERKIFLTSINVEPHEALSTVHKKSLNKYFDIYAESPPPRDDYWDPQEIQIWLEPTSRFEEFLQEVVKERNKMVNLQKGVQQLQNDYIKKTYG